MTPRPERSSRAGSRHRRYASHSSTRHMIGLDWTALLTTTEKERAILNIKACLEAAGSSLDKVVRRRIYIIEMGQFRTVDEVWGRWFEEPWPVSTCVQIGALAKEGALVELEVVASV